MKRHLALVGLMGSGKTSVGRALARRLGRRFVDTDELIVAARGRTIARIFTEEGEPAFRRYEFAAVREALAGEPAVVATGGGAVTHGPTHELLAQGAIRIYLAVPPAELFARLRRSRTTRPLLGAAPALDGVATLLAAREPLYRQAEIVVRCDGLTRTQVVRAVAGLVEPDRAG